MTDSLFVLLSEAEKARILLDAHEYYDKSFQKLLGSIAILMVIAGVAIPLGGSFIVTMKLKKYKKKLKKSIAEFNAIDEKQKKLSLELNQLKLDILQEVKTEKKDTLKQLKIAEANALSGVFHLQGNNEKEKKDYVTALESFIWAFYNAVVAKNEEQAKGLISVINPLFDLLPVDSRVPLIWNSMDEFIFDLRQANSCQEEVDDFLFMLTNHLQHLRFKEKE